MSGVKEVVSNVSNILNQRLVQLSLVSGVLFYIVANPALFDFVRKTVQKAFAVININIKFDGVKLLLFHSSVFALLFWMVSHFLLDPVLGMLKKVVK